MNDHTHTADEVRRFIIENQPVRGHWVHLGAAWRELRAHQDYPPAVRDLLGQAVGASVLLAATLKFRGTLTLQLEGNGAVRLLVAQCTHDFGVRAVARFDDEAIEALPSRLGDGRDEGAFRQLVGDSGRVLVTIEATEREMRYQGVVPLVGNSLAESLEQYFLASEQLPTRVQLAADEREAVGVLVQRLPGSSSEAAARAEAAEEAWTDAARGVGALAADELLAASVEDTLSRTLGDRDLRLFGGASVRSECRCNPERVAQLLRALGLDEVRDVVREQGSVTVTCEFCQRPYRFTAEEAEGLFESEAVPSGSGALH